MQKIINRAPGQPTTQPTRRRSAPPPLPATRPDNSKMPDSLERGIVQMLSLTDSVPDAPRHTSASDYLHVSALIRDCPRKLALMLQGHQGLPDIPTSADALVRALGRAAEQHVRRSLIKVSRGAGVFGVWTCPCTKTFYEGEFNPRCKCEVCGKVPFDYSEMLAKDEDLRITGSPDFVFSLKDGRRRILEIKSKSKKLFDELKVPEPIHIDQVLLYHPLLKPYHGELLADEVGILYVCKDYSFTGVPYRMFVINTKSEHSMMRIEQLHAKAKSIWGAVRNGSSSLNENLPPPLPACMDSIRSTTPKNCDLNQPCFSCRPPRPRP